MFADEIGVFDKRSDRADFFATVLSWMEVTKEADPERGYWNWGSRYTKPCPILEIRGIYGSSRS